MFTACVSAQPEPGPLPPIPSRQTPAPAADQDRPSWQGEFAELAGKYRAADRGQMADTVEHWILLPYPDRQLLFLAEVAVDPASVDPQDPLDQQFVALRRRRAEALWKAARRAVQEGDADRAYRLIQETLRDDPQHTAARRALSQVRSSSHIRLARGTGREKRLGWLAGRYWRATSAHFSVVSNTDRKQTEEVVRLCETFHCVWRQLFTLNWIDRRAIEQALDGRPLSWSGRRRHQVVVFDSHEQFVRHLKPLEPNIEIATGVYRDKDRITYLHAGQPQLQATWLHELTHQLFQESAATELDVGATANFWIVEAVAMYCESTRFYDDHCLVGGWDAERLQTARYRQRNEGFYVPLCDLSALTRQEMQHHADIRRLYTQSAGLSHFFMDGRQAAYRKPFLKLVRDLYRQRGTPLSIAETLDVAWPRLDRQYVEFLDVQDSDLARLPHAERTRQLSLGFTHVTDAGLRHLSSATQLEWLDLTGLSISDTSLSSLQDCIALKRLSLAGTKVTDEGLRQLVGHAVLQEIDLSGTLVTDKGLNHLVENCPRLSALWLANTGVTAEGVRCLAGLKHLTELDLEGTSVTAGEWRRLRDLFPGLAGVDPVRTAP